MHFVRLFSGASAGRTEKRAVVLFQSRKSDWLKGTDNYAVKATLTTTEVERIRLGREYVKYLIRRRQMASDVKGTARTEEHIENPALKISAITCIS